MRVLINGVLISVRAKRPQFTENQETSTSFGPKKLTMLFLLTEQMS